ncbi:hypothetical protein GGR69_001019 [Xanthomonas arboricola]|nr:hypothetical protein [Xanthomonas arboricola]
MPPRWSWRGGRRAESDAFATAANRHPLKLILHVHSSSHAAPAKRWRFIFLTQRFPGSSAAWLRGPRRCEFAAGPLPAHHRRTRRKYVHVGSYAASMPRKVPRRWAGKDQARWSVRWCKQCMVCVVRITVRLIGFPSASRVTGSGSTRQPTNFSVSQCKTQPKAVLQLTTDQLPGAVSLPVAGPLAAWMPPRSLHGRIHGVSRKR